MLNLSLGELPVVGQLPPLNTEIDAAIAHGWSKGALVVAAAGNETFPLCSYPSFSAQAVCVGATDKREAPSFYSNFPINQSTQGVRAPGGLLGSLCEDDEDIWSTVWPGAAFDCAEDGEYAGYETLAGTSMATAFVAGVAALLFGKGLSNQQVVDCLLQTARKPYGNGGSFDPVYGYGIVDAAAAVQC